MKMFIIHSRLNNNNDDGDDDDEIKSTSIFSSTGKKSNIIDRTIEAMFNEASAKTCVHNYGGVVLSHVLNHKLLSVTAACPAAVA